MITVKTVEKRSELRKFIAFPNKLFKDVPSYIPALDFDEINLLTDKNPSLEHCSRELYLAYKDGKVAGRVAAIINHSVNEHWQKKAVRFGWFDFIEDYDVFTALLDKVVEYGRANGMTEVEGPFGFTDMDKECWAIDNFDARQNTSTLTILNTTCVLSNARDMKSNAAGSSTPCRPISPCPTRWRV